MLKVLFPVQGYPLLSLRCHEDNKEYKYKERSQFGYGHYQASGDITCGSFDE
jgi:hypothetical protein